MKSARKNTIASVLILVLLCGISVVYYRYMPHVLYSKSAVIDEIKIIVTGSGSNYEYLTDPEKIERATEILRKYTYRRRYPIQGDHPVRKGNIEIWFQRGNSPNRHILLCPEWDMYYITELNDKCYCIDNGDLLYEELLSLFEIEDMD